MPDTPEKDTAGKVTTADCDRSVPLTVQDLKGRIQDQQTGKLLAFRTLAGGIAQDFNEILVGLKGYVELAQLDIPKNSPARNNLSEAMNVIDRATDLVTDLLAYSRLKKETRKPQEIGPIVQKALAQFEATLPKSITLSADLSQDMIKVNVNATQIRQIITNLCTNASEAMLEKGGEIAVALETVEMNVAQLPPESFLPPGRYVCLSVRDTGCGMDADTLERIFDPYFSTSERGVCAGMGLAVVNGIIHAYNGYIDVESETGKGSTFTIILPEA